MIDILIVQGTTPSYEFDFADEGESLVTVDTINKMTIVFSQRNGYSVKKSYTSGESSNTCSFNGNTAVIHLSQEETLGFTPNQRVEIKIKVLLKDGNVLASDTYLALVEEALDKEVLK